MTVNLQEHAHKQAKRKAMEMEVVTLSEEEQNVKIYREEIYWQIQTKAKEIEQQKSQTRVMQERFVEEVKVASVLEVLDTHMALFYSLYTFLIFLWSVLLML